ncbi:glucosaminidase domain-containing protein [Brevibacillus borstelensis]|uniref:glucosaminidase domain-containing protein n=1 Tax=Brevibacillus borstelensis TaxID=45462 RepID=UPI0030C6420C
MSGKAAAGIRRLFSIVLPLFSPCFCPLLLAPNTALSLKGGKAFPSAYKRVILAPPPAEAAQDLQKAGYATDPAYADKLTNLIRTYNLTQYDQVAPKEKRVPEWKQELGLRALKEGLITSPEWLGKLDVPMPVWAVFAVALLLLDKKRNMP